MFTHSRHEAAEPPSGHYRFIALDVETASRDVGSICQIGIACVDWQDDIHCYSTLVNPQVDFDWFNIKVHGIRAPMVSDAPSFGDIWPGFLSLLARHQLIQHSRFDASAIKGACAHAGLAAPDLAWHDSITFAKKAWPDLKGNGGYGLAHLKQVLDLDFRHHDAEEDARAAALVVLHAEKTLGKQVLATDRQLGLF